MGKDTGWIGIAGLGYWGKNILRNLYEMGILKIACDTDLDSLTCLKDIYKGRSFTNSFKELISDPAIDAVVIATPAATHHGLVKQALLEGKDVLVEKPLALSQAEGEELVGMAEERGRILMVGHTLQYHPAVRKLKGLIRKGELGKIQYIYSNRLNIGKLRSEENILWSFAPHDISVILMLLEDMPLRVSAFGEDYLNKGVYDTTLTTLEFPNSVKGHVYVSWLHPYKEQRLVVVGTRAMAVFDDVAEEKLRIYPHKIEWRNGKTPVAQKAEYVNISVENVEPLRMELEHFVECVRDRKIPMTDGREGLRVLEILQLAEECLSAGSRLDLGKQKENVFVHESAYIDEDVYIGEGTKVWHFSHIIKGSRIGRQCVFGQNVMVGPDVDIGNRCKIQNNVSIYKGVTLEDDVFCGPSCVFTNVHTPRSFIERKESFIPTIVKRGASIGANATIVCGVTIGRYALIGAGAVVKDDVPDHAVVAGVPAAWKGWACSCGAVLEDIIEGDNVSCEACGRGYSLESGCLKAAGGTA